jgi:hypothetical protein
MGKKDGILYYFENSTNTLILRIKAYGNFRDIDMIMQNTNASLSLSLIIYLNHCHLKQVEKMKNWFWRAKQPIKLARETNTNQVST